MRRLEVPQAPRRWEPTRARWVLISPGVGIALDVKWTEWTHTWQNVPSRCFVSVVTAAESQLRPRIGFSGSLALGIVRGKVDGQANDEGCALAQDALTVQIASVRFYDGLARN